MTDYDIFDEDIEDDEPEEGTETSSIDEWGIKRFSVYHNGEWQDGYKDPGWDYVYDESDSTVLCPNCSGELRFHNGKCCCIECMSVFSKEEIDDCAGPWYHS